MAVGGMENSARQALRKGGALLTVAFVMSFVVNILRLAGPLFMILVYDRVLSSRSEETLFALLFMVVILMLVLGVVDYSRKRLLARFGAQFQERLEHTILGNSSASDSFPEGRSKPSVGLDEADTLRSFFHSGGLIAVMDFIWVPMFFAVVFFLHPWLGFACLIGMLIMLSMTLIQTVFMGGREERNNEHSKRITSLKNMLVASRDVLRSQTMTAGYRERWLSAREAGRDSAIALRDWTAWFEHMSSTVVMVVRYVVLAIGAYLTLRGQLTVGAMVGSTFLVTRVLIPVNRFSVQLPSIARAYSGWVKLRKILAGWDVVAADPYLDQVGNPRLRLAVTGVTVRSTISGSLILKGVNLKVSPGEVVEILGGSGEGKTVLAETICGLRKLSAGAILVDGINIDRLTEKERVKAIGYVPEDAGFIEGSIAENISRLDPDETPEKIAAAARKACLHAWISALPNGYQTVICHSGAPLSKGQRMQLTLARALYFNPMVLVFDSPDEMLLDRLPKTMKKTFEGVINRGGVIIFLSRKALKLDLAREQYKLENNNLKKLKPVEAADGAKREAGKVTVLSDKLAASKASPGTRGA